MSLISKENLIKDFWESEVEFRPSQIDEVLRIINKQKELNAEEEIIDPVDLVRDLAERIGIHQLYAIAVDLRGEP